MIKHFGRILFTLLALQTSALATVQSEEEEKSLLKLAPPFPKEVWQKIISFAEDSVCLCYRLVNKEGASIVEVSSMMTSPLRPFEFLDKFKDKEPFYPFTHSHFLRKSLAAKALELKCDPGSEIESMWGYIEKRLCKLYDQDKAESRDPIANRLKGKPKGRDQFEIEILYKVQHIKSLSFSKEEDVSEFKTLYDNMLNHILKSTFTFLNAPLEEKEKICSFYMMEFQNYLFSAMASQHPILSNYLSSETPEILSDLGTGFILANDLSKGNEYFQKVSDKGDIRDYYNLGVFLEKKGDRKNASKYYQLAADQGFALAQNNLARYFEKEDKLGDALKYYQLAADQGFAPAQYNAGYLYEEKNDLGNALKYTQLAADQGFAPAQYNAGYLYEEKKDLANALRYYQLAADQGDAKAQNKLDLLRK